MNKKRSIFLLMSLTFLVGYVAYSLSDYVYSSLKYYESYQNKKTIHLLNYLKLGEILLRHQEESEYQDLLHEARDSQYIDFFIVKKGGNVLFYENNEGNVESLNRDFDRLNEILFFEDIVYSTVRIESYTITIGFNQAKSRYLKNMFSEEYGLILRDFAITLLGFFLITFYFLKDIRTILQGLRTKSGRGFGSLKPLTSEAQTLLSGLRGYENQTLVLGETNRRLESHILPSLRSELRSGKQPPYQFNCTLVRTDINNFSLLFNTFPVEEVMAFVNKFLTQAASIVDRYGGYVHETVGDEIIYYFKDQSLMDSVPLALACVRDIHKMAQKLDSENSMDFDFSVKTALANGNLRYGRLLGGFGLAGSVLIESSRLLSHIDEKNSNQIIFGRTVAMNAKSVCRSQHVKDVNLKGFTGTYEIYSVEEFLSYQSFGGRSPLSHFRSDEDLLAAFRGIESHLGDISNETLQAWSQDAREFRLLNPSSELIVVYWKILKNIASSINSEPRLAAWLSVGTSILGASEQEKGHLDFLSSLIKHSNPRVAANAVELLGILAGDGLEISSLQVPLGAHNRVEANFLIALGKSTLSASLVLRLRGMLEHKEPLYTASGLFALGEIYRYHLGKDRVYLLSHGEFCELMKYANDLQNHDNVHIRAQARRTSQIALQDGLSAA